jgi:putative pyruvate formate lyase activating enzyme
MEPAYITAYKSGALRKLAEKTRAMLARCEICPRRCKVNRLKGEKGFCRTGTNAIVYSYMSHRGEEPPISGEKGSGTVFFANCNMACCYCQNFQFSQQGQGRGLTAHELSCLMIELQENGCHNINLVSPTHVMPQIISALEIAAGRGLKIPLVYNTGGYELPEMIGLLDGIVDVYLPDMRYADAEAALAYSHAVDYPKFNQAAVREMYRQVGLACFDEQEMIERGVIVRHLVLPENISGTEKIMKFLAEEISPDIHVSLMSQYFPCYRALECKELSRRISREEFEAAQAQMEKYGLHNGWTQEAGGLQRFAGTNIKPSFPDDTKNHGGM